MAGKKSSLRFNRKRRKRINYDIIVEIISWVVPIAIVILIAGVLVNLFAVRSNMIGQAMEPTIRSSDQILIDKFGYILHKPKTGDVIVFLPNGNERSHYYVRRIVAGPGDEVVIRDGKLLINGAEGEWGSGNPYLEEAGICSEPILLAEDEYFVLGDNPDNSEDSRYANIGNVKEKYIIGRAWFHFRSISEMGFVR